MTSPLVLRPATSVDTADLERLAALDSARPLEGDVLLAYAGGDVRAALSLESGRAVADPFYPSAELVDLLRAAAGDAPAPPSRRAAARVARPRSRSRAYRPPRLRRGGYGSADEHHGGCPGAPAARRSPVRLPGSARRASPWWWLVVASALVLVGRRRGDGHLVGRLERDARSPPTACIGTLSADRARPRRRRRRDRRRRRRRRRGAAHRASSPSGGRRARPASVRGGVLRIASRCPETVIGTLPASSYRIAVPDNVQVNVRTSSGRVRIAGLNGSARVATGSGAIAVDGFCGFHAHRHVGVRRRARRRRLLAGPRRAALRAAATCAPSCPPGRYRVDANSDGGTARVRGLRGPTTPRTPSRRSAAPATCSWRAAPVTAIRARRPGSICRGTCAPPGARCSTSLLGAAVRRRLPAC